MPSLTIRIRTPEDEAAIEALKAATRERTAAGALMRAARTWSALMTDRAQLRQQLAALRAEKTGRAAGARRVREAELALAKARAALADFDDE